MPKQHTSKYGDKTLEDSLFAFRRKLTDTFRREASGLKFPISHIDTLAFIAHAGSPSMKEISSHLKIAPPSATAIIETLQKKKLIERISSKNDRRTVRIELTPKAWKFLKSLHERKLMIFTKMLSKLSESDKKQLIKILAILIEE